MRQPLCGYPDQGNVQEHLDSIGTCQEVPETTEDHLHTDITLSDFAYETFQETQGDEENMTNNQSTSSSSKQPVLRRSSRPRAPRESWKQPPHSPSDFRGAKASVNPNVVADHNNSETQNSITGSVALSSVNSGFALK